MSALAEALIAAQAELPCVLGIAADEDTDGPADPDAAVPF